MILNCWVQQKLDLKFKLSCRIDNTALMLRTISICSKYAAESLQPMKRVTRNKANINYKDSQVLRFRFCYLPQIWGELKRNRLLIHFLSIVAETAYVQTVDHFHHSIVTCQHLCAALLIMCTPINNPIEEEFVLKTPEKILISTRYFRFIVVPHINSGHKPNYVSYDKLCSLRFDQYLFATIGVLNFYILKICVIIRFQSIKFCDEIVFGKFLLTVRNYPLFIYNNYCWFFRLFLVSLYWPVQSQLISMNRMKMQVQMSVLVPKMMRNRVFQLEMNQLSTSCLKHFSCHRMKSE